MRIAARLDRIEASPSSMGRQRARELRETGRDLLSLTTGEPDMDTPPHVIEAALRAMKAGQTKYTDPGGTPELKAAVCRKLKRENGLDYTIAETIISSWAASPTACRGSFASRSRARWTCWRSAARASRARARN